jgi:predicted anti-sigma-YlaC factor YlaD
MQQCDLSALSELLDGELSLPAQRDLQRHLRSCVGCRTELEALRRVDAVIGSWSLRADRIPPSTEARIQHSIERRRGLARVLAFSRMMPAAVGSCIAAILVVMSANLGMLYQVKPNVTTQPSATSARQLIQKQSVPLLNARRSSAILSGRVGQSGTTSSSSRTQSHVD